MPQAAVHVAHHVAHAAGVARACAGASAIAALATLLMVTDVHAQATPRSASAKACSAQRIGPQREHLSQVLKALSAARGFELRYWTDEDPIVSHEGGTEVEVMKELAGQANTIVRYSSIANCPGRQKIDAVWVLASGAAPMPGRAVPAAPLPSLPGRRPLARAHVETPAESEATRSFLEAHGFVPKAAASSSAVVEKGRAASSP